jgi:hypothetical protein
VLRTPALVSSRPHVFFWSLRSRESSRAAAFLRSNRPDSGSAFTVVAAFESSDRVGYFY